MVPVGDDDGDNTDHRYISSPCSRFSSSSSSYFWNWLLLASENGGSNGESGVLIGGSALPCRASNDEALTIME